MFSLKSSLMSYLNIKTGIMLSNCSGRENVQLQGLSVGTIRTKRTRPLLKRKSGDRTDSSVQISDVFSGFLHQKERRFAPPRSGLSSSQCHYREKQIPAPFNFRVNQ